MAFDTARIIEVGDALVEQVRTLSGTDVTVKRTYFRRFDIVNRPEEIVGRWAFVRPLSDEPWPAEHGGDRVHDPFLYRFVVGFAERIPKEKRGFDEKDALVDCYVNWVTVVRDAFDESRDYSLLSGVPLVPVETGVRTVVDDDLLNNHGLAYSEFTTAIREG